MNVTCAILAGGFSTRIGQDKATLIINGKPLMNHVYERVQTIFNDIVIVSSNHSGFKYIDAPVIKDILPIKSPMVGIVSALVYSHNPYVYVCACAMPYLNEDAIRYIIERYRITPNRVKPKQEENQKKSIFHFARAAKVTDNAPRSCPQNGVTSYATFICRSGFTYRTIIIACFSFCTVLRSD